MQTFIFAGHQKVTLITIAIWMQTQQVVSSSSLISYNEILLDILLLAFVDESTFTCKEKFQAKVFTNLSGRFGCPVLSVWTLIWSVGLRTEIWKELQSNVPLCKTGSAWPRLFDYNCNLAGNSTIGFLSSSLILYNAMH